MVGDTIVFRRDDEPLTVGVHDTTLVWDGREYPVTMTVHEDGSITVRSEGTVPAPSGDL